MTTPARRFANDDDAAQHWLTLLRDGDADQKIAAREQLATIFEHRGMHEEAAELLVANVKAGVRNADIFRRLARLFRAQGDEVTANQAAAEAAKYLPTRPPAVSEPAAVSAPAAAPIASGIPPGHTTPAKTGSALGVV
jgi:predicted Zn-dependent protease